MGKYVDDILVVLGEASLVYGIYQVEPKAVFLAIGLVLIVDAYLWAMSHETPTGVRPDGTPTLPGPKPPAGGK